MANFITRIFSKVKDSYHRLLNLPEAPQKVAQGIALGIAFDFLPVPIISIPLSFIVAKLIRVHAVAATLTVLLFKWAVPLFFTLNIFVGKLFVESGPSPIPTELGESIPFLKRALLEMKALGLPFLVGSIIDALIASLIVYFVSLKILQARQRAIKKNPKKQPKGARLKHTKLDYK